MNIEARGEKYVFDELGKLCASPGYFHVIAYLCFRDNTIGYDDELSADDVQKMYSIDRLIRTEISTLIGLAIKGNLDLRLPEADDMQNSIDKTDALLGELHNSMTLPKLKSFDPKKVMETVENPLSSSEMLREAIFYSGEGAFNFQYRELSSIRYSNDTEWFVQNKGFAVDQAISLISTLSRIQDEKIKKRLAEIRKEAPKDWTLLPIFKFTIIELAIESGIDEIVTRAFIDSLVLPNDIDVGGFSALDDFNPINAYPIIDLKDGQYLLFQSYGLVEAFYETPFFWFLKDANYLTTAQNNRGIFTEQFSQRRLKTVFGAHRVYSNIDIYKGKNEKVGEIDVLVIFANRAIILQAKSKKLTIASRKGNIKSIKSDFKKAVQEAYDQALVCANCLSDASFRMVNSNGNELNIPRSFEEIYPFCIVSDHYPALSIQAHQFLNFKSTEIIKPPFVMDVFLLDVMTEMLDSPLQFLSYINRRVSYSNKVLSNHELTVLSYHLKQNLWVEDEYSIVQLGDDICADLDVAMLARRENVPGLQTPEGILTKYRNTPFGRIIEEIDTLEEPRIIDFGFAMLSFSRDTIEKMNDGIAEISRLSLQDGMHHDITLGIGDRKSGITLHSNFDPPSQSSIRLEEHCRDRKYLLKADSWYGVCLNPINGSVKFGINLKYVWQQSDDMDQKTKGYPKPQHLMPGKKINLKTKTRSSLKIGRNERCPCGSGKKYKRCCLV